MFISSFSSALLRFPIEEAIEITVEYIKKLNEISKIGQDESSPENTRRKLAENILNTFKFQNIQAVLRTTNCISIIIPRSTCNIFAVR